MFWPRRYPDSVLRKAGTLYMSAVPGILPQKIGGSSCPKLSHDSMCTKLNTVHDNLLTAGLIEGNISSNHFFAGYGLHDMF